MLPPTIPTSFVPHPSSVEGRRMQADYSGVFGVLAYGILAVSIMLAIGVFFYGRVLANTQAVEDTNLEKALKGIDSATVENFIRLRDRLTSSLKLLDAHVAYSALFTTLEKILPTNVRLTNVHLSITDKGVPKLEGAGVAKNFNALASASTAFGQDGRIKGAIFSNISINKDSTVSFSISATLDPKLVTFSP